MLVLLIDDHALFRSGMRLLLSDLDETIDFNLYQRLAIRDTSSGGPTLPNGTVNVKTLP